MIEKPDYVKNFKKPKKTEIKHISNCWYLYEYSNVYDKLKHRTKKISGKMLGKITENGFISRNRESQTRNENINSVIEVGASSYFYSISKEMRERLKRIFPDIWEKIYATAILRIVYEGRIRRLNLHFENSILSSIYKNIIFNSGNNTEFLKNLGARRDKITEYMNEDLTKFGKFLLFDGHRILSASKNMEYAEIGYDSKKRYMPQVNLLYIYSLSKSSGFPVFYKKYLGSTPDVTAFRDLLKEINKSVSLKDITVIADRGFPSELGFDLIEEFNMYYIMPLRRGNKYSKENISRNLADYTDAFIYNKRGIHSKKIHEDDKFNVFIYYDLKLFSAEDFSFIMRNEKINNENILKKEKELTLRSRGKGKLTDEELLKLEPLTSSELYKDRYENGIITIKTNNKSLTAMDVYTIYKQRQNIEQFFKTYTDTMDLDDSCMRNSRTEEAWLFLNHLSAYLGVEAINNIESAGLSKKISLNDLRQILIRIQGNRFGDYNLFPIKSEYYNLCKDLNFDIDNLETLKLAKDADLNETQV